ncbi:MAG: YihY/virulence factor BrkB family protein [Bdellovibrionia bacterium]
MRNVHGLRLKATLEIIWETFKGWKGDRCNGLGAALAFFALLAVPSFFVLAFMLVDEMRGRETLMTQVIPFLSHWLNPREAVLIRYLVTDVTAFNPNKMAITISGVILMALGVGGFASQLRTSIRLIWGKKVAEVSPAELAREQFMAVLIPLTLGIMVALGVQIRIFLRALLGYSQISTALPFRMEALELVGTVVYWGLCCAVIYKLLIPAQVRWKEILPGAFLTSLFIGVGRYFGNHYLMSKDLASLSGVVGDIFAFLLLFYFYAQIFLVGAELTRVLALRSRKKHLMGENVTEIHKRSA